MNTYVRPHVVFTLNIYVHTSKKKKKKKQTKPTNVQLYTQHCVIHLSLLRTDGIAHMKQKQINRFHLCSRTLHMCICGVRAVCLTSCSYASAHTHMSFEQRQIDRKAYWNVCIVNRTTVFVHTPSTVAFEKIGLHWVNTRIRRIHVLLSRARLNRHRDGSVSHSQYCAHFRLSAYLSAFHCQPHFVYFIVQSE